MAKTSGTNPEIGDPNDPNPHISIRVSMILSKSPLSEHGLRLDADLVPVFYLVAQQCSAAMAWF